MAAKITDRLITQLQAKGMDKKKASAVANSQMRKSGNIDSRGNATAKGELRGNMTPAQRAKDRAVKASGGSEADYKYNSKNNTAVKGKVNSSVKTRK